MNISKLKIYFLLVAFIANQIVWSAPIQAQVMPVTLSPQSFVSPPTNASTFHPLLMKGLKFFADQPLKFDFLMDTGDVESTEDILEDESYKLINYFLAALTVPEKDLWVNLSSYEEDRIITDRLARTEMGRDLLSQDYLLKQFSATLMNPDSEIGASFWERVYQKLYETYGQIDLPVDTFHKIWIVPDHATLYEEGDVVLIMDAGLKVMLEEDYLALEKSNSSDSSHVTRHPSHEPRATSHGEDIDKISTQIMREVLLPEVEYEINHGQAFAPLRQMYHSLVLATWFKDHLKENVLTKVYVDQNKVSGIDSISLDIKNDIYHQYVKAFKEGLYDLVQEEYDPATEQLIPRRYFSGGVFGHKELSYDVVGPKQSGQFVDHHTASESIVGNLAKVSGGVQLSRDNQRSNTIDGFMKSNSVGSKEDLLAVFNNPLSDGEMQGLVKSYLSEVRRLNVEGSWDESVDLSAILLNKGHLYQTLVGNIMLAVNYATAYLGRDQSGDGEAAQMMFDQSFTLDEEFLGTMNLYHELMDQLNRKRHWHVVTRLADKLINKNLNEYRDSKTLKFSHARMAVAYVGLNQKQKALEHIVKAFRADDQFKGTMNLWVHMMRILSTGESFDAALRLGDWVKEINDDTYYERMLWVDVGRMFVALESRQQGETVAEGILKGILDDLRDPYEQRGLVGFFVSNMRYFSDSQKPDIVIQAAKILLNAMPRTKDVGHWRTDAALFEAYLLKGEKHYQTAFEILKRSFRNLKDQKEINKLEALYKEVLKSFTRRGQSQEASIGSKVLREVVSEHQKNQIDAFMNVDMMHKIDNIVDLLHQDPEDPRLSRFIADSFKQAGRLEDKQKAYADALKDLMHNEEYEVAISLGELLVAYAKKERIKEGMVYTYALLVEAYLRADLRAYQDQARNLIIESFTLDSRETATAALYHKRMVKMRAESFYDEALFIGKILINQLNKLEPRQYTYVQMIITYVSRNKSLDLSIAKGTLRRILQQPRTRQFVFDPYRKSMRWYLNRQQFEMVVRLAHFFLENAPSTSEADHKQTYLLAVVANLELWQGDPNDDHLQEAERLFVESFQKEGNDPSKWLEKKYQRNVEIFQNRNKYQKAEKLQDMLRKQGVVDNFMNATGRLSAGTVIGRIRRLEGYLPHSKKNGFEEYMSTVAGLVVGYLLRDKGNDMVQAITLVHESFQNEYEGSVDGKLQFYFDQLNQLDQGSHGRIFRFLRQLLVKESKAAASQDELASVYVANIVDYYSEIFKRGFQKKEDFKFLRALFVESLEACDGIVSLYHEIIQDTMRDETLTAGVAIHIARELWKGLEYWKDEGLLSQKEILVDSIIVHLMRSDREESKKFLREFIPKSFRMNEDIEGTVDLYNEAIERVYESRREKVKVRLRVWMKKVYNNNPPRGASFDDFMSPEHHLTTYQAIKRIPKFEEILPHLSKDGLEHYMPTLAGLVVGYILRAERNDRNQATELVHRSFEDEYAGSVYEKLRSYLDELNKLDKEAHRKAFRFLRKLLIEKSKVFASKDELASVYVTNIVDYYSDVFKRGIIDKEDIRFLRKLIIESLKECDGIVSLYHDVMQDTMRDETMMVGVAIQIARVLWQAVTDWSNDNVVSKKELLVHSIIVHVMRERTMEDRDFTIKFIQESFRMDDDIEETVNLYNEAIASLYGDMKRKVRRRLQSWLNKIYKSEAPELDHPSDNFMNQEKRNIDSVVNDISKVEGAAGALPDNVDIFMPAYANLVIAYLYRNVQGDEDRALDLISQSLAHRSGDIQKKIEWYLQILSEIEMGKKNYEKFSPKFRWLLMEESKAHANKEEMAWIYVHLVKDEIVQSINRETNKRETLYRAIFEESFDAIADKNLLVELYYNAMQNMIQDVQASKGAPIELVNILFKNSDKWSSVDPLLKKKMFVRATVARVIRNKSQDQVAIGKYLQESFDVDDNALETIELYGEEINALYELGNNRPAINRLNELVAHKDAEIVRKSVDNDDFMTRESLGGIDFDPEAINVQRYGSGVDLPVGASVPDNFLVPSIDGVLPIIFRIEIIPPHAVPLFLSGADVQTVPVSL